MAHDNILLNADIENKEEKIAQIFQKELIFFFILSAKQKTDH